MAIVCISCAAQSVRSVFDTEHAGGVDRNPPGIELRIATVDGRSTYHASDRIRFKLVLTSKIAKEYTVETISGMSDAGGSDDFVVKLPGSDTLWHTLSSVPVGLICCDSKRHYVTQAGSSVTSISFSFESIQRFVQEISHPPFSPVTTADNEKPREYYIFLQTGRVMRGWPRSQSEKYHGRSPLLVTSSNVLHITVLPDAASASQR